jgi:shikimate kinase
MGQVAADVEQRDGQTGSLRGCSMPARSGLPSSSASAGALFANNAHVRAVQELLGHSRSDMTLEIYTSSVPDVLRTTAATLDSLFDEALLQGANR